MQTRSLTRPLMSTLPDKPPALISEAPRSLWEELRWRRLREGENPFSLWRALWQAEQQHPRIMAAVAVLPGVLFVAGGAVLSRTHGHVPILAGISFAVGAVWLLGATVHIRANCEEVRSRDEEWNNML